MLRRLFLLAPLLAVGCYAASESVVMTAGCYLYSTPVVGETLATGPGMAPIPFDKGRLTDGDVLKPVYWPGNKDAPLHMSVVFDLLADTPIESVVLSTRRPNKYHRTDNVSVDCRAEWEAGYHMVLFSRDGIKNPWDRIEIPLRGRKARYVRITFSRRHSFVNTPLTEVEVRAARRPGSAVETEPTMAGVEGDRLAGEFAIDALLVDRYGQFLGEEWPGKIQREGDFAKDRDVERVQLAGVARDPERTDIHGGRVGGAGYLATGFFRLEKEGGRWWLVTPEGHPFFMNGVDVADYREASTALENRNGVHRGVFAELPPRDRFPEAYEAIRGEPRINFVTANLKEKYGQGFDAAWTDITKKRLLDWGFNANAKWSRAEGLSLPFITVLRPAPETRRILWAVDPYDPGFAQNVEAGVAGPLASMRDDPLIIGHTFESEKGWNEEVVAAMLKLGADSPAKAAFVDFLLKRHGGDEAALARLFGVKDGSPAGLLGMPLDYPPALQADGKAFVLEASRRYYRTATEIIRRHDPNHIILGSSLTIGWHSSYEWDIGAADYTDALSFDCYNKTAGWIEPYLAFDKPILLLEYSFVVSGRGMPSFHSVVSTQQERGLAYRRYMESLAAKPQFVGAGWFQLYDQAVTGRDQGGGGECYNFGLINQQDQPYEDMLSEVKKTSARLFDVHAGLLRPFERDGERE